MGDQPGHGYPDQDGRGSMALQQRHAEHQGHQR